MLGPAAAACDGEGPRIGPTGAGCCMAGALPPGAAAAAAAAACAGEGKAGSVGVAAPPPGPAVAGRGAAAGARSGPRSGLPAGPARRCCRCAASAAPSCRSRARAARTASADMTCGAMPATLGSAACTERRTVKPPSCALRGRRVSAGSSAPPRSSAYSATLCGTAPSKSRLLLALMLLPPLLSGSRNSSTTVASQLPTLASSAADTPAFRYCMGRKRTLRTMEKGATIAPPVCTGTCTVAPAYCMHSRRVRSRPAKTSAAPSPSASSSRRCCSPLAETYTARTDPPRPSGGSKSLTAVRAAPRNCC